MLEPESSPEVRQVEEAAVAGDVSVVLSSWLLSSLSSLRLLKSLAKLDP